MPFYQLRNDALVPVTATTFAKSGVLERNDLQRLLKANIEIVSPKTLVIAEEFGDWADSRRRIDLLGIDRDANLVVIELKRTEDGGHMELQALRYAAMVSALSFEKAVDIYDQYLKNQGQAVDAQEHLLDFLGWETPDQEAFGGTVRIALASADFSRELTTSVLWLNQQGLDIRCVRLQPYQFEGKVLVDVQQVIPLPEAQEYQVSIRDKVIAERVARRQSRDFTKYVVEVGNQRFGRLPKRRAIFQLIKHLCDKGISPDAIGRLFTWRSNTFRQADGSLNSTNMYQAIAGQQRSDGSQPDPERYFIEDSELIHTNGKTYALTKMWGARTEEAMQLLVTHYPNYDINFSVSDT